ncbi:hypothetical protein CK203_051944 [Vitis vinifera]|uniref:Uncharacterized protein n=1 Tax=Vitis vinifera TaxID=29760 RepID=A0A438GTJ8_VITVI|nr:hypothetical protein CK203_051944 [Vitis vinifera]
MDQQVVTVDQFTAAMASIQEALASLRQEIDGQQGRPPVARDDAQYDPTVPPPSPPSQSAPQAMPFTLHSQTGVAPPPITVPTPTSEDPHARMDRLEQGLRQLRTSDRATTWGVFDGVPVASLPAKFRMPDIERYMVVGCLYTYLRLYSTVMRAHGLDGSQMITMFPLSLSELSMRELEGLRQRSDEFISSFISHRQGKIAEIVDRPLQRDDSVLMVIRGLIRGLGGKFRPNWSGPYFIRELTPEGAAWLMDLDGNRLSEPTNVDQLKRHSQVHGSWGSLYVLHFIYEGMSFDHWVFEPSFLSFLSPYHLGLRYVPCLKTTLRPWDRCRLRQPLLGQDISHFIWRFMDPQICTIIIAYWMLTETWTWSLPYGAPEIHPASSALLDAWMPSCLSIWESCTFIPTYEIHIDTMFPSWSLSGVTQLGLHLATLRCHHAFLPRDAPLIYGSGSVVHVGDLDCAFDDGFDDGFLSHVHSSEDIRCPFSHWSMRHDWRISSGVLYTGAYPFSVDDGFRYGTFLGGVQIHFTLEYEI